MIKSFPKISDADMAFGGYPADWFKTTLKDAEVKGFGPNNCDRTATLFYKGGSLNLNKELDSDYITSGVRTLKAILCSFNPKHEHKMAVCEYILSNIEVQEKASP